MMYRVYRRIANPARSDLECRQIGYVFRGKVFSGAYIIEVGEDSSTFRLHRRESLEEVVS